MRKITTYDKNCFNSLNNFGKDMDWLKLNHPKTWAKYQILAKKGRISTIAGKLTVRYNKDK